MIAQPGKSERNHVTLLTNHKLPIVTIYKISGRESFTMWLVPSIPSAQDSVPSVQSTRDSPNANFVFCVSSAWDTVPSIPSVWDTVPSTWGDTVLLISTAYDTVPSVPSTPDRCYLFEVQVTNEEKITMHCYSHYNNEVISPTNSIVYLFLVYPC